MRFTPWATRLALTLSLSATAFLTACGGGGDGDSNAQVRLLNATRSYPQLDLSVNDKAINSKVAYASVGEYASVGTNATASRVSTSDTGTSISATTPTLAGGSNYTYITYGFAGAVRTTLLLNLAPDAGAVDVYLTTAANCALTTETAQASNVQGGFSSGYTQANSGTFRICATGYNKRSDLRLEIPAVTFDSDSVNVLVLTATEGGVLVNGITLVQKGAAKNFANTQSRVRTVAALANGGTVTSSISPTEPMLNAAISPLISDYVTTTAGAKTLSVVVDGTTTRSVTPTLGAGKDTTLLVWGDPANPQLTVLDDDNRLPTVSGDVKVRLVNALPTSGAGLNVAFGSVASNIASGSASTFSTTSSSTTGVQVDLTMPVGTIYTNTALVFPANSVWTFFAVPTKSGTTTTSPIAGLTALPKRERP
jgi:hypothetical protein